LISKSIAIYAGSVTITTDLGAQFESDLFGVFAKILDTKRIRTKAYYPASNGLVEAAIRSHECKTWPELVPSVLLSIQSIPKQHLKYSSAEMVFGKTLRLPRESFSETNAYARRLRRSMNTVAPAQTTVRERRSFIPENLKTSSHIVLRVDAVGRPQQRTFLGYLKKR
jgi:hypothetical protein